MRTTDLAIISIIAATAMSATVIVTITITHATDHTDNVN
jgi:hypothetical protein